MAEDGSGSVDSRFTYPLSDNVKIALGLGSKHNYMLHLKTDFKDKFKEHHLDALKLGAKLECKFNKA